MMNKIEYTILHKSVPTLGILIAPLKQPKISLIHYIFYIGVRCTGFILLMGAASIKILIHDLGLPICMHIPFGVPNYCLFLIIHFLVINTWNML